MTKRQTPKRERAARTKVKPVFEECDNLMIKAIGNWNQQAAERNITRRNGSVSYSLLKIMFARGIGL